MVSGGDDLLFLGIGLLRFEQFFPDCLKQRHLISMELFYYKGEPAQRL